MSFKGTLYECAVAPTRFVRNALDAPAVILLYHRVARLPLDTQRLAVTPEHFSLHIEYLRTHCRVLSIDEFLSYKAANRPFPKRSVLITFDDGYADNCIQALPLLESKRLQALFYVTTSLIDTSKEAWWDGLERIVYESPCPTQLTMPFRGAPYTVSLLRDSDRAAAYAELHRRVKYCSPGDREQALASLQRSSGIPSQGRPSHRFMTRAEIATMASSPSAVLGAHTHHHVPLSKFSRDQQAEEIKLSVDVLQSITGERIRHFSYPYGLKKDYNADSMDLCRSMGFEMVCANYYGQVHRWTDRFSLPRIIVRDWPLEYFERNMRRFFRY